MALELKKNPYVITNDHELQCIDYNEESLNANYILMNNIDASGTINRNSENGFTPIGNFKGRFDGNEFIISGLKINRSNESYVGLFSQIDDDSTVKNVSVLDADIKGDSYVGGLVGRSYGKISESCTGGVLKADYRYVGGLVGENNGTISESYATGSSTSESGWVGGLVGQNNGTISESYAKSSVKNSDNRYTGGLVGRNEGEVSESYAMGDVDGNDRGGGFVGHNLNGGDISKSYSTASVGGSQTGGFGGNNWSEISESYWDTDSSGHDDSYGGEGLTTNEMQGESAKENMPEFDFENIWKTVEGAYPVLQALDKQEQLDSEVPRVG